MYGVQCINCCSTRTHVKDSRARNGQIYRRRKCLECQASFSTKEIVIRTPPTRDNVSALRQTGMTYKEIAAQYGTSLSYVWRLVN